jgi:hypothetical protein
VLAALVGLGGLGLLHLADRREDAREAWILAGLGAGAILGSVVLARWAERSTRAQAERDRRRAEAPLQPWTWRSEWTDARGIAAASAQSAPAHYLALLFGVVSIPIVTAVLDEFPRGNRGALIGLVFPLVGLGFAAQALRELWMRAKYGVARLRCESLPLPLGRSSRAVLHVPRAGVIDGPGTLTLACIRTPFDEPRTGEFRRNGRPTRRFDEVLWTDVRIIEPGAWRRLRKGLELDLELTLPKTPASAIDVHGNRSRRWVVKLDMPARGLDLALCFDVPVYSQADLEPSTTPNAAPNATPGATPGATMSVSPSVSTRAAPGAPRNARPELPAPSPRTLEDVLVGAGLQVDTQPVGPTRLTLPKRRYWRDAWPGAVAALVLLTIGCVICWARIPLLFACGAWFAGALYTWMVVLLLRDTSGSVRIEGRELITTDARGREQRYPVAEIRRVRLGDSFGSDCQRFHDVAVDCDFGRAGIGGRPHTIARRIRGDLAARTVVAWVEREIQRAA